ncbi:MAG: hypothetical protein ACFB21_07700 [Opitutales bacterium]
MVNRLRRILRPAKASSDDETLPDPEWEADTSEAAEGEGATAEAEAGYRQHWLGVGFDGTLASVGEGPAAEEPGAPIFPMIRRVEDWLGLGLTVKVFTWRGATEEGRRQVQEWLVENGLPPLDVTDTKDFEMVEFWDVRGVQVIPNSGHPVGGTQLPLPPEA